MNLPNKLTVLRMALIPVFLVFMLVPLIPNNFLWALLIFGAASFTDYLDGSIARKQNLVTDFGKIMDPLADKILCISALVCFVESGYAPALFVAVILAREFLVTSVRLLAAGNGQVIAADIYGKIKTVLQMVWILLGLLLQWVVNTPMLFSISAYMNYVYIAYWMVAIATLVMTVFSGVNYVWKNRGLFSPDK